MTLRQWAFEHSSHKVKHCAQPRIMRAQHDTALTSLLSSLPESLGFELIGSICCAACSKLKICWPCRLMCFSFLCCKRRLINPAHSSAATSHLLAEGSRILFSTHCLAINNASQQAMCCWSQRKECLYSALLIERAEACLISTHSSLCKAWPVQLAVTCIQHAMASLALSWCIALSL